MNNFIYYNRLRQFGLSSTALKIIALVIMVIDHIGCVFMTASPYYMDIRTIGRISFPIYCFLIAEGMFYTRDIRKYAWRLGAFALISEIPYDLAFYGTPFYWHHQNVFITLFLAVFVIAVSREFSRYALDWCSYVAVAAILIIAEFSYADYGAVGVFLILLFYYMRDDKWRCFLSVSLLMLIAWWGGIQIYGAFAMSFLLLYNGKKGAGINKYVFYGFYPVHLIILWLVQMAM